MTTIRREALAGFSMNNRLRIDDLPNQLVPDKRYSVRGTNGNNYTFQANNKMIGIASNENGNVRLLALINQKNQLEWRLYTRLRDDFVPNHDLFAGLFYDAAMRYLLSQGNSIDAISENWNSGTNQAIYRAKIRQGYSPEDAAFSTWSGRKASEHGFNQVIAKSPTGLDVFSYYFLFLRK